MDRVRTVHAIVHGRVQGVGFRAWVQHQAELRGLEGWVRNRRDGTVEAVVSGPAPAVDAMLAACRQGPASARVERVETDEATGVDGAVPGQFLVLGTA
ncbi:MAG TPA: acylphosphatase [Microvirga sp.]|jgi:acylphosphatase|nr:acylphosphatase [Microvirga sp.]